MHRPNGNINSAYKSKLAEGNKKERLRYVPALDGLRSLAVLAVIAYHMGLAWAPGGLMGVTIFFVLSGYLITNLLTIEFNTTGSINLPQFWLRRVRRLMPAIVFVIVATVALCTIFDHAMLTKMRADIIPSLLWFSNWHYIFSDISYFQALGAPSPLTHFWSLSIEEQFYVVWPLLLLLLFSKRVPRKKVILLIAALALVSAALMAFLFDPSVGSDPSRVYYGTDTRAFSLLLGALLAFVWPANMVKVNRGASLALPVRIGLDAVGIAMLVFIAILIAFVDGYSPFWYYGGTFVASVAVVVLIAVVVHPSSVLGRVLAMKPLVWIGLRSYGIYLWHYPVILLTGGWFLADETPWFVYVLQLLIIFGISMFSYTFIENPIRKGVIGRMLNELRSGRVSVMNYLSNKIAPTVCSVSVVAVAAIGLIFVPETSALEGAELLKQTDAIVAGLPKDNANVNDATQQVKDTAKLDILTIGDSVSVRAIPYFTESFPYGAIDSAVSRQFSEGISIFNQYARQDIVGDIVVFALGTNGPVNSESIAQLMETVGSEKRIFFINTRSTTGWVDSVNDALWQAQEDYSNVKVIDWHGFSSGHPEYFDGDGTHLTEDAAKMYADMVYDAVSQYLPKHDANDEVAYLKSEYELSLEFVNEYTEKIDRNLAKLGDDVVFQLQKLLTFERKMPS